MKAKAIYDQLRDAKPIDRLARMVTSGGSEIPPPPAYTELSNEDLRRQAVKMRAATGLALTKCKDAICQTHGYKDFQDYVRVLSSRDEYTNYQDLLQKKRAARAAKRHAERLSDG